MLLYLHYGCKVNQYETNAMSQLFIQEGYNVVDVANLDDNLVNNKIDIYIINTCTVTSMSDKKSRQMLRKFKNKNPRAIIVATGCYAQIAKKELEKIAEIDIILGNNEKKDIVKYVKEYEKRLICVSDISSDTQNFLEFGNVSYLETTRAVIKIQDGCNNFCTYCIIPYARGRIRSRKKENILSEIQQVTKKGIKEVVLTGIHIASYGKDKDDNYYLIDLLEDINKINGLKRIRIGSLEPTIITTEFCERLKKIDKLCDHFHLSLQSGCDKILRKMNRKYNTLDFKNAVVILRKNFLNVHLTTDIIVGFPGEDEEAFLQTYMFLSDIKFFKMHVFKYSKRKGTLAETFDEQVVESIKEERSKKLIELSNKNEEEYLKKYIGKTIEVLFEEEKEGYYIGHTKNYMLYREKANKDFKNFIKECYVERVENLILEGFSGSKNKAL